MSAHGDETADGSYGASRRPSQGCDTIPSTIGAMPASNGASGAAAGPAPPIAICVPFAGPPWTLLCTIVSRARSVGVSAAYGLWITNEPPGADRRRSIFARGDHPHLHASLAAGAAHVVDVLRFREHFRGRRRFEPSAQRQRRRVRFARRINRIIRQQRAQLRVDVRRAAFGFGAGVRRTAGAGVGANLNRTRTGRADSFPPHPVADPGRLRRSGQVSGRCRPFARRPMRCSSGSDSARPAGSRALPTRAPRELRSHWAPRWLAQRLPQSARLSVMPAPASPRVRLPARAASPASATGARWERSLEARRRNGGRRRFQCHRDRRRRSAR